MPNRITNLVKSSHEVLNALGGEDELVNFCALIPISPEATGMTQEYTATSLVDLLTGGVNFHPSEQDCMGKLKLDFIMRVLTERGGIAALDSDEFEKFMHALRYQRYEGCFKRHHVNYPSDWLWTHWGTKENAWGAEQIGGGILFKTQWSPPHHVIARLACRFPDEKIELLWAGEVIGENCGHRIFESGGWRDIVLEDPVCFALEVTWEDHKDYERCLKTGKYRRRGS